MGQALCEAYGFHGDSRHSHCPQTAPGQSRVTGQARGWRSQRLKVTRPGRSREAFLKEVVFELRAEVHTGDTRA